METIRLFCGFPPLSYPILQDRKPLFIMNNDSVLDSYEEQEFWMTRQDWFRIRLNQFEKYETHENCLSRWKQCYSSWKQCWKKTMYK